MGHRRKAGRGYGRGTPTTGGGCLGQAALDGGRRRGRGVAGAAAAAAATALHVAARRGDLLAGEANSHAAAANTAGGADGDAGAGHAVDVGAVHVADHLAVVSQARAAIADDATPRREAQALQVDDLVGRQVAVEAAGGVGVTIAVKGIDSPEAVVAVLAVDVAAGLLRDQPLVDGAQAERTLDAGQDGVELVEDVLNLVHDGAQATRSSSAGGERA